MSCISCLYHFPNLNGVATNTYDINKERTGCKIILEQLLLNCFKRDSLIQDCFKYFTNSKRYRARTVNTGYKFGIRTMVIHIICSIITMVIGNYIFWVE